LLDTKPIREGWLDKKLLYDIRGRSREKQIKLADEFGIDEYPSPAGGCLLTEPKISLRMKDLMKYDMDKYEFVLLLRCGRHFRISDKTKLILGRNKKDNEMLDNLISDSMITLQAVNHPGPLGVINFVESPEKEDILLASKILLRYIAKIEKQAKVSINSKNGYQHIIEVKKLEEGKEKKYLIT